MPAASSRAGADSEKSVHQLLEDWQARAARGEHLQPHEMLTALAEATGDASPDLPATVELPGNQSATVSLRPPAEGGSPSGAFENLSSRWKALSGGGGDGEPAADGLADYELLREVARGGMGVVYEVRQKSLNRIVALKMIRAGELADAEDVARFYSEAEAAANLRHPNIVAVYQVGRAGPGGEHHYFTMDFVAGPSLLEIVREQPLDGRTAARYVAKVARAMQFAHDRGVLHRDLKPANILLSESDEPLVTDFGLAKRIGTNSGVTIAGTVLGTPSYMPPEQAAGNLGQVGPLSDVYSLGAVLYECVTGRPPFASASVMDVFQQVLNEEPLPPSHLSPRLPRDLETICLKCLQKDRARRYQSAGALADDLERFLKGEPVAARPVGRVERAIKWARRHPAWAALWGVLAAAALVVLGVSGYYNHQLSESNTELSTTVTKLGDALADATTQRRAERRNNYANVVQRAEDYWQELPPNLTRARELLASLVPEPGAEDLRGVEWLLLSRMCSSDDQHLHSGRGSVKELAILPTGRILVFRDTRHLPVLSWIDEGGKTGDQVLSGKSSPSMLRFSTQTDWAVGTCAAGVDLRSRQDPEQVVAPVQPPGKGSLQAVISADGRWIVWCESEGRLGVWNIADRKLEFERQLEDDIPLFRELAISPDGNWFVACAAKQAYLFHIATRAKYELRSKGAPYLTAAAFAGGSDRLALAYSDGQLDLHSVPPGRERSVTFNTLKLSVRPEALAFIPPGNRLAIGSYNGLLLTLDIDTGRSLTFRGHTEGITRLASSPDGKWIYSGSSRGEVLRWDTAVTDQRATILSEPPNANDERLLWHCLDYSPDGRWLAVGGRWVTFEDGPQSGTGGLLLVDAATHKIQQRLDLPHQVNACRFTPDSGRLVYGSSGPLTPGRFWVAEVAALGLPRELTVADHELFAAAPLAGGEIGLAGKRATVLRWSLEGHAPVGEWQPKTPRKGRITSDVFGLVASRSGRTTPSP